MSQHNSRQDEGKRANLTKSLILHEGGPSQANWELKPANQDEGNKNVTKQMV